MGDTIVIETPVATVLEVSGLQGPQGPTGAAGASQADVLTTQGDLLYRGASAAQRLGIGTAGQILKVNSGGTAPEWGAAPAAGVSSVNGDTGAVSVTPASIDAAEANHDHQPADIYCDAAKVTATTLSAGEPNGVYFRDVSDNGKATYRSAAGYSIFWDDAEGEWVLGNVSQSQKYFIGLQDTTYPWQVSIAWTLGAQGSGTVPTVGQATLTDYQLNAAQDSVSTRVPKSGNATSTEVVLGSDTRLTNSRTPTSHAASHNYGGSDAVTRVEQALTLMDTSPDNEDNVALYYTSEVGAPQKWVVDSPADFRTALELGTAATAATGDFAAASHTHELTALAATGATNGHVLTANGSNGVTFAALPASGVTGAASSASDVLGVSGANITGVDAGSADRLVFWDDSANKLTYLEAGSGLSISGTTMTVTATGGATNLWIAASQFVPRTTNGCGVDSRETSTNRQNFDELLFDAGTDEFAQALIEMPSNYNNGTITARFYWTASSGSGSVIWGIQGRAFADDDALDTAAGAAQTVTDTLLAANDMHVSAATSAVTIGGTPAANTPIQFQIYRDADAAGDTLAVDARLLGVEIIFN